MSMFDNSGSLYLCFYLLAVLVSVVMAYKIIDWIRTSGSQTYDLRLELHPYEIAYLNEGSIGLLRCVMTYLIKNDIAELKNIESMPLIEVERSQVHRLSHLTTLDIPLQIETSVCSAADGKSFAQIQADKYYLDKPIKNIEEKLINNNLLVSKSKERAMRLTGVICILIPLVVVAIPRIIESIFYTHKPIEFLVVFSILTVAIPFVLFRQFNLRTRAGDSYLHMLQQRNRGLELTVTNSMSGDSNISAQDLALAVALFGMTTIDRIGLAGSLMFFDPDRTSGSFDLKFKRPKSIFGCNGCSSGGGCGGCGG